MRPDLPRAAGQSGRASVGNLLRNRDLDVPPPPHFRAQYGEHIAQIELGSVRVINGSLPTRALRLVSSGPSCTLTSSPRTGRARKELEPLVPIEPLP
jgi:uncharacterized protein DUF4160